MLKDNQSRLEDLGWWLFILGLALLFFNWFLAAFPLTVGYLLTGGRVFRALRERLFKNWTDINHDRWVDYFSYFFILPGLVITLVGLLVGPLRYMQIRFIYSALKLSEALWYSLGIIGFGAILLTLGFGIRRRHLWAGILGLCVTFLGFWNSIDKAFRATEGNLNRLPIELVNHGFSILFAWLFFFGFYQTFFPAISSKAAKLADSLEGKLKESDKALQQAREMLEDERVKLRAIFETTREGIALFDREMKAVFANPAFSELFEISADLVSDMTWSEIIDRSGYNEVQRNLSSDTGEISILDEKGGVRRNISFYTRKITNSSDEFVATMILSRDTTLEREISRVKSEFVSNVSHELRTPLTSIRAYAEMLLDGETENPETTREYLMVILDEAERLTNLINDILDLSKMESGKKVYRFCAAEPGKLLQKAVQMVMSEAQKKGQTIEAEIPEPSFVAVFDQDMLYQALLNLVNNAVKYTPNSGSIYVTLTIPDDSGFYRIIVKDNGIGISAEDQQKLFSKFFRVESTLLQEVGGTGLGLALVKQIADDHGGRVEVESSPGKGSTFTLVFPVSNPALIKATGKINNPTI
ncbi:MAG: PAS domain S-box protein [Candidatus Riflebacteria bacterium]|nr:PAS domain S-box protein [Candidatus Riflebacteria bacterium]